MFLYHKIVEDIKQKLKCGELRSGDPLPPERELAVLYNASSTSIRKAMKFLEEEDLIVKKHGSGNYVKVHGNGVGAVLLMHGNFSDYRPGICGWFQKVFEPLEFKVEIRTVPGDIADEKILAVRRQFPGVPVLMINSRNATAELAKKGRLENLEEIPFSADLLERMPDNLKWSFSGPDGVPVFYSMPYSYVLVCSAINTALAKDAGLDIERPPRFWNELLEWCRKFTEWKESRNKYQLFAGYATPEAAELSCGVFLKQCSGGNFYADSENLRKGLPRFFEFERKMVREEYVDFVGIQSPDPFVSGKYLFSFQAASWLPRDIAKFNPALEYRLFPTPLPEFSPVRYSFGGTSLFSMSLNGCSATERENALRCMRMMYAKENAVYLSERLGTLPSDISALLKFIQVHPEYRQFYDSLLFTCEPHNPDDGRAAAMLQTVNLNILMDSEADIPALAEKYIEFLKQNDKHTTGR